MSNEEIRLLASFAARARNEAIEEIYKNLEERSYEAMRNFMRDGEDESRIKSSTYKIAAKSIRSLKSQEATDGQL